MGIEVNRMLMWLVVGIVLGIAAAVPVRAAAGEKAHTPRLVAYYAGWATYSGRDIAHIDASRLTHLIYAFANIGLDGRIAVGDPTIDTLKLFPGWSVSDPFFGNFGQLWHLKQKHPHLKVLIAVGGWSWSGRFSDVALTEESRRKFAESVVEFVVRFQFDGVDIDWEYPVSGGLPENIRRPQDKQNFTLLMEELRRQLDAQGEKDGKEYLLSFAGAAASYYTNNIELSRLHPVADFINLMTYDLTGPWETRTGFNSPLSRRSGAQSQAGWSIDDAVQLYRSYGVPAEKINVGVPFYGYRFEGVPNQNNGLFQPFTQGAAVPYYTIQPLVESGQFTRYWHEDAQVPYLFDGSTYISYDDPQSMAAKAELIRKLGLGGAMIWEISQDVPDRSLLAALHDGLYGAPEVPVDVTVEALPEGPLYDDPDFADDEEELVVDEAAE